MKGRTCPFRSPQRPQGGRAGRQKGADRLALSMLVFAVVCLAMPSVGNAESSSEAATKVVDSAVGQTGKSILPPGFVAASGAKTDARSGLPTRIVHRASGIVLVLVPAGEFHMGSPEDEPGHSKSESRHRRVIRKPFYLGESEVTVAQFRRFVRATRYQTDAERGTSDGNHDYGRGAFASTTEGKPSPREWTAAASWRNPFPFLKDYRMRDDHPVIQVSWNDAREFCKHFGLRLPTEAQWEYAYRAGSCTAYPWGDKPDDLKGYENVVDLAYKKRFDFQNVWFPFDDGVALLSPVRSYRPNAWGLYDMGGNLQEWCEDAFKSYPQGTADESAAEGDQNSGRVIRGGSWLGADHSRAADRFVFLPAGRRDFVGFRVAYVPR